MRFVIVTGMSGAGKSSALNILEDFGYYCVDNLPNELLLPFAKIAFEEKTIPSNRVALGIDVRSANSFEALLTSEFRDKYPCEILFLDAADEVLMRRYKETRRPHPMMALFEKNEGGQAVSGSGKVVEGEPIRSLAECIALEREKMEFLRSMANCVLDTGSFLTRDLRAELHRIYVDAGSYNSMYVNILSFGYKYGIPKEADLVFDVRFLPNPFYIPELKSLSGLDKPVADYVMGHEVTQEFFKKLTEMVRFLIPLYQAEGRTQLVIAIGCTGGRHRSVTIANALYEALSGGDFGIRKEHTAISAE
ncbi:MAG: RNase adapter RapZ [Lachnospiraceae bacterium]|nr:RNase adapter RapZ [Lachnospiraceae bacterium]